MSETAAAATPIMRQYQALKAQNPDAILFFRLGDFYELFDEDARRAAPILELVLTQRQGIPMCGLPHHALPGYLGKLLKRGWRVAIAEQMEDPATTKGMVRRDVVRVVTPGTVLEEELLPAKQNNFLAAAWPGRGGSPWGLAWADMSTGELSFASLPDGGAVADELSRWDPRETLWPAGGPDPDGDRAVTRVEPSTFLPDSALRRAPALFGVKSFEGYGLSVDHPALPAVAALLNYIERNQAPALGALRPPRAHAPTRFMALDALALRRLDLFPSDSGGDPQRPTSLWHLLDHTATAMGGRRLKGWMVNPLMDLEEIAARQDRVDYFLHHGRLRRAVVDLLRETADVERVLSRLTAGTASGRDLNALRRTLRQAPDLERTLRSGGDPLAGQHPLGSLTRSFQVPPGPGELLEKALAEDPPQRLQDGGVIRDGYSAPLDEWRQLARNGRGWISDLERAEREKTGIGSLKIGFTSVFGYYLEVSKTNLSKVPAEWIRKQTLTNAERFVTPELKAHEDKVLSAEEKAKSLERELLAELRQKILAHREPLIRLAEGLAETDALASLAEAAERGHWTRPRLTNDPVLRLEGARHPVVERMLEATGGGAFVPNDLELDGTERQLLLVTGPNMGGKSTYLRQSALIVLLAQMGSFVPAARATVGLVDRIFTRIGAGDNLAAGASTFLVEMQEVANILHNATPRSLVILDEVGRGTSTYDGVAVAWAVADHLAGRGAAGPRTLFATHYFELTELPDRFPRVANVHAAVREWAKPDGKMDLVLLHEVRPGPAERSFGVHVAQMAGLPADCVTRAAALLAALEKGDARLPARPAGNGQMDLFANHPVLEALRVLDPERLTPLEALQKLAELKRGL